jgi:hypothetical protein
MLDVGAILMVVLPPSGKWIWMSSFWVFQRVKLSYHNEYFLLDHIDLFLVRGVAGKQLPLVSLRRCIISKTIR